MENPLNTARFTIRRRLLQGAIAAPAAIFWHQSFAESGELSTVAAQAPIDAFKLADVKLLDGPFKTAQQLDAKYLLSLEPDRLLHNFRVNAGLTPKAAVYGGWESKEPWIDIRCHGHTLGHYLSACAMMAAATGESSFERRCSYIVTELADCQHAAHSGLICAFPDGAEQLENSLTGKKFIGVPWYTTHKVMAGLRDVYVYTENQQALDVLVKLADWIVQSSSAITDTDFQHMLDVEHGGMNEVLADLYALTHNDAYLTMATRFCHHALLDPLAERHDTLDGLHSNTQIPKVIGFARIGELTDEQRYGNAALYFWQRVVNQRSFATGGNGDGEHFFPPSEFQQHLQSGKTMETCCTHNMLKLTHALFLGSTSAKYAEYYERALYNGILASQDPDSGMMTYFQSTRPGYLKLYCTPVDSFWCCTGTGMENHAKYGESIYFHNASTLYVNLFIASELNWTDKDVQITQHTTFPDEASTQLVIHTKAPQKLTLKIRQPAWCKHATIRINGHRYKKSTEPGSYIELDRVWRNGDVVSVDLPMHLHLEMLPNTSDIAAIMYGPLVLAARLGTAGITPGADLIVNERTSGDVLNVPMTLPNTNLSESTVSSVVLRKHGKALSFSFKSAKPQHEYELIPYYRIAHERYNMYWQLA